MEENKNKGFIKIILLVILIIIIGFWINSKNNDSANVSIEAEQAKELEAISETSESTELEDLEADINIDINLDDLDDLEKTLDEL